MGRGQHDVPLVAGQDAGLAHNGDGTVVKGDGGAVLAVRFQQVFHDFEGLGPEGIIDHQDDRGGFRRFGHGDVELRVQVKSIQLAGIDDLTVDVRAGAVRQFQETMRRGEVLDLVLVLAQVMEKIIQACRWAAARLCAVPQTRI